MESRKPKKAKKKTSQYTEETLKKALADVREKKLPVREICRKYQIPKSTILDRIHGKTTDCMKKRGPDPVLGTSGERKVVEWLVNIAKCGFPVKKPELLDSIQKIIKDSSIPNKFKNDRPGQTWYLNFLKRNPEVSSRSAEGINRARAQVSEESIRNWFKGLESFLDKTNQKEILNRPASIFNGDESGFSLCPKTGKVLGPRGFRNLYNVQQGNEKDNLTVLVTFNANGDVCPPCVVFPYVRPPRAVVESMPPDWCLGKSETGWMRGDVFFEYITNDFNNWLERNNIQKPVLLLVDGHKSHMSLMLSTVCEQMKIILYALPPNTTHILQPADVSVFAPLKANWKNTVRKFLAKPENTNASVTKTNFCTLFAETLQDTNLSSCIKNGFRRCGLYPFDPNAPDYTKCVIDTLVNINTRQTPPTKNISRADVATTKKVLKQIKLALLQKNVNFRAIMKELNVLKKTLPVESTNVSEVTIDTESDCTNSTLQHVSANSQLILSNSANSINVSKSVHTSEETQQIPLDLVLDAGMIEIARPSINMSENCDSISSLHITGSFLEVGSVVSLDDIVLLPLNVTEKTSDTLNVCEKLSLAKSPDTKLSLANVNKSDLTPSHVSTVIEVEKEVVSSITLTDPEKPDHTKTTGRLISLPTLSSTPIPIEKEAQPNPGAPTGSELEESDQNVNEKPHDSPNSCKIPDSSPTPNIIDSAISSFRSVSDAQAQKKTESTVNDPFERHLYLPDQTVKTKKSTMNKTPAAISSAAWREHYNMRENLKNKKQEETRKRKLERCEKQQQAKILKESNSKLIKSKSKVRTRRVNSHLDCKPGTLRRVYKENNVAPTAAAGKISCSACDDDLISDVDEDEDKNIGCDVCPRWYHLKCTVFQGQTYLDVKDQPYKCTHCV